ncbi:hypothetical protein L915_16045 [Phytophthora nicotianae]|uniref:Probable pectate lyase F n=1 Tax=Phytophthora nicotianae TaxID=4792 RepID=W2G475_PHYNI|nr:hypothetical protein L915_16045 [Phytophthora nicotianae]ETL31153.1 hypothetical protein L916_15938 [Phytophthora nicotianae]
MLYLKYSDTYSHVKEKFWATVQYKQAYIVNAGEVFDGKMRTYERSDLSCQEQTETGADTSVFKVEAGGHLTSPIVTVNKNWATLKNVWAKSSKAFMKTVKNTTATVPDGARPDSTGSMLYKKPYIVKAGEVFDG